MLRKQNRLGQVWLRCQFNCPTRITKLCIVLCNCALIVLQLATGSPPSTTLLAGNGQCICEDFSGAVNPISAHLIMPYRKQLNVLLTLFDYVQRVYKENPPPDKLYNNILVAYLLWGAIKTAENPKQTLHRFIAFLCPVTML